MTILLLELLVACAFFLWIKTWDNYIWYDTDKIDYTNENFICLYIGTALVFIVTIMLTLNIQMSNYNHPYKEGLKNQREIKAALYTFLDHQKPDANIKELQLYTRLLGLTMTMQSPKFASTFNHIDQYLKSIGINDFLHPQREDILLWNIDYSPNTNAKNKASCLKFIDMIEDAIVFYRPSQP